jgi:hypothetical protein
MGSLSQLSSLRRRSLTAVAAVGVTVSAIAGVAAGAPVAHAASGITFTLSPTSGTDFTTNQGALSWQLPAACVGNEADVFLYKGNAPWNADTINQAEGNTSPSEYYANFSSNHPATAAGSVAWPNVPGNYSSFGSTDTFASTAALVASKGTGLYTMAIACLDASFHPILDSTGAPVAASLQLNLGATGNSWAVAANTVSTTITLSGSGSVSATGQSVSLTAKVTAADGSTPTGTVNFFAGGAATGTPLNGSTPVAVNGSGIATFSGKTGFPANEAGAQSYTAVFVPGGAGFTGSTVTSNVDLIQENVTIKVAAAQDALTASTLDLTATATGSPASLAALLPKGGVDFVVDGVAHDVQSTGISNVAPFQFSSSGVATAKIAVSQGAHVVSAILENQQNVPQNPGNGFAASVNTVNINVAPIVTTTTVATAGASNGLRLTATVASPAGVTAVPAGTVAFAAGAAKLGSAPVSGAAGSGHGAASVLDFAVPAGVSSFTATFTPAAGGPFVTSTGSATVTFPIAVTWVQAGAPAITGTAKVGSTLTAHTGAWNPAGVRFAYQWLANGTAIAGATGSTLALGSAELGKTVSVDVTGFATGDITADATSAATAKVAAGTLTAPTPAITGTLRVGSTLAAHTGTWQPSGVAFHFQWLANGKAVHGATGSTFRLPSSVANQRISVQVIGSKTGYTTLTKTSAQTKAIAR